MVPLGSGSKAVGYLTTLGVGDEVLAVIDINPHKAGQYLAGTGHRIERLPACPTFAGRGRRHEPVYKAEIAASLDAMGCARARALD